MIAFVGISSGKAALAIALAFAYPGEHSMLRPGGPQAANIEWLYWVIFWITFVVYVLVVLGFTRAGART